MQINITLLLMVKDSFFKEVLITSIFESIDSNYYEE